MKEEKKECSMWRVCKTCGNKHENIKQPECGSCRGKKYNKLSKNVPAYVSKKDRGVE